MVNITTSITFHLSFFSVLHISLSSSKDVVLYLTSSVEQKCMHLCSSLSLTAQYFKFIPSPIYFVFFEFFKFSLCFWKGAVKFLYFRTLTMPHLRFLGFVFVFLTLHVTVSYHKTCPLCQGISMSSIAL